MEQLVKQSGDGIDTNNYYKSEGKEAHYRERYWDFSYYILNPVLKLGVSPESTVSKIGCGLGGLVIPASYDFYIKETYRVLKLGGMACIQVRKP